MSDNNPVSLCFGNDHIRYVSDENGKLWFVAHDVCKALNIPWRGSRNFAFLDDDEKGTVNIEAGEGKEDALAISESALWALVFRSPDPKARAFSKYVRTELLPPLAHWNKSNLG